MLQIRFRSPNQNSSKNQLISYAAMTDQAPSVRVTGVSARKALLSFLGPPASAVSETPRLGNGNGVGTQNASIPDPRREARQEATNLWKEYDVHKLSMQISHNFSNSNAGPRRMLLVLRTL